MTDEGTGLLSLNEHPALRQPALLAAFAGWPDAGEVATGALRYLVAKLSARRLGYIDSDAFYDYGTARPITAIEGGALQSLRYPASDLFYWRNPEEDGRDLVFLLATEPQLRWRRYVRTLLNVVRTLGVETVVTLGGLFDSLPHTAEPRLSGLATSAALRHRLAGLDVNLSEYTGPSSIHTSVMQACQENGFDSVSLWGHAPHYVRTVANPKVCHALLSRVSLLLEIPFNLADLQAAGEYLDETLNRLLGQNDELRLYVQKLEEQLEGTHEPAGDAGSEGTEGTERIIRDVEDFLRREQRRGDEPGE
jgi:proteasome assembly chaperone (PAC2) family protein